MAAFCGLAAAGACDLASATIGTYTMNYMTTFASHNPGAFRRRGLLAPPIVAGSARNGLGHC